MISASQETLLVPNGGLQLHDLKDRTRATSVSSPKEILSGSQSAREFSRGEDLLSSSPPIARKRRGTLTSSLELLSMGKKDKADKPPKANKEKGKDKERDTETSRQELFIKQKSRSDGGSLMVSITKRFMERSGFLQKSTSLIDLNPPQATRRRSASFILGKSGHLEERQEKAGYFGLTLEETMAHQHTLFPTHTIPVILVKLIEGIIKNDGCKAEGIFRIAGSSPQVVKLQLQYNDMNFNATSPDPHVYVGVLKQWLRELKSPLIPTSLYYECLAAESPEQCVNIIAEKLPPLNKDCLAYLVRFLRDLAQPDNQEYTKMDVHNLCIVFAPVLFRCPSTDMTELMINLQKEKLFLVNIVESTLFS